MGFLIAALAEGPASASPVTYEWLGSNGVTGSFALDSALFNPLDSAQFIAQSNYSALPIYLRVPRFSAIFWQPVTVRS